MSESGGMNVNRLTAGGQNVATDVNGNITTLPANLRPTGATTAMNRRRRRLDPRNRVETQRASIRREAQGLGRESSQRFWTFGPERGPGPAQGRQRSVHAAVGSEDPRKIDSTWHIPPG